MQILLPFLLAPKKAEEKIRWHPEAADSPFSWNCLDLDNILGISKLLLLKFILKRNIFISSAIFSTNYKEATDFLIKLQHTEAMYFSGVFCLVLKWVFLRKHEHCWKQDFRVNYIILQHYRWIYVRKDIEPIIFYI